MYDESTMKPLVSNMHSSLLFPQETQACAMCLILATGPDQQVRKSCVMTWLRYGEGWEEGKWNDVSTDVVQFSG